VLGKQCCLLLKKILRSSVVYYLKKNPENGLLNQNKYNGGSTLLETILSYPSYAYIKNAVVVVGG